MFFPILVNTCECNRGTSDQQKPARSEDKRQLAHVSLSAAVGTSTGQQCQSPHPRPAHHIYTQHRTERLVRVSLIGSRPGSPRLGLSAGLSGRFVRVVMRAGKRGWIPTTTPPVLPLKNIKIVTPPLSHSLSLILSLYPPSACYRPAPASDAAAATTARAPRQVWHSTDQGGV